MPIHPRVLTIPASRPHLRVLAEAILAGEVLPGWPDRADPLSLAVGTILLPNRRACRAMRDIFAELATDGAVLLPRIAPIGDVDEEEWAFADPMPLDALGLDAIGPEVPGLDRRLTLAMLVRFWAGSVDKAILRLQPDDPLIVSTGTADALALAADLMRLMDQVATERVPWAQLDTIVDSSLDPFWRMTAEFLRIAREAWPAHLAEKGLEEPAIRRDRMIAAEAQRLAALPGPIIAAGSTGSILATRDLLKVVAHHPRGALVLPGLDMDLDAAGWEAIDAEGGAAAHAHPQFGLKRLITHVGIDRESVAVLAAPAPHGREALVSEAMRPAATTDRWAMGGLSIPDAALDGVTVIEAANEREEALAIAIVLREVAEDPTRDAALVTPDRELARRVMAELGRWNVPVDDSGGRPLTGTAGATVARLSAALALQEPVPADLLALLDHPAIGLERVEGEAAARDAAIAAIELRALRGLRPPGGLAGFLGLLDQALPSGRPRPERPASRVTGEALAAGRALLGQTIAALAPLAVFQGEASLATLAAAHLTVLEALGLDASATGAEAVADLLKRLAGSAAASAFTLRAADYPAALDALMQTETVRLPGNPGARIRILGLVEARLLAVDCVVMAGLVEGSWPGEARLDPWLNRAMRASFGIDPPERRVGLAAHDFCQLFGQPQVVLTRATKAGGVPTVPSRWMQRLAAVLGPERWRSLIARGQRIVDLAGRLDVSEERPRPALRPNPSPPLALRPTRLSVTEIETLQRDPYAIYARHVLKLTALEALDQVPGAIERGIVIHGALDAFTKEASRGPVADPVGRLVELGRKAFAPYWDDPSVRAVWWPRYLRIAAWFAGADADRRRRFVATHAEREGFLEFPTPAGRVFRLTTKADRIDVTETGTAEIVDYKTGSPPSAPQVNVGLAPQLALEGAVLKAGGFAEIPAGLTVTGLVYAKLGGRDPAGDFATVKLDTDAETLIAETLDGLRDLVAAYENERRGYLSWAMPQYVGGRSGDYAHLARVKEWSTGAAGGEDA
ncbi:double-strand break repair protein AddB [Phreatobacter sp.]|uniref:double-strand break repair protein AddB n=1 Tax=Phreatobacter sp. TaxID=1966341 RepID=UPI0022C5DCEA|nr:double-strand break repair protein AddB [Phreatobacter sp.]MCZ8316160.1 double-strand break repair protein AddB [Phreatobacter sp.]